jgi:UPF0755 protein
MPTNNIIINLTDDDHFADTLTREGISNNFFITKISIKIMALFGYEAKFGEYALPHRVSLYEAIKIINSGNVVIHRITIPEGFPTVYTLRRIESNEHLSGEIEQIPQEGSIMPGTYCFKYPTTKQEIIRIAQKEMVEFLQKEWPKRSLLCTLKNPYEVLILASIVEKETSTEREIVAGVYLHRLKINMKLQSCPTVIYAHKKGKKLEHTLKYSELNIDSPYNTYRHKGLPPTPITNPGKESIIATLHPQKTENLFFVFDGISKHIFSKTYEEHKRNIAAVRKAKPQN